MKKRIFVIGPDGTGKTEISTWLAQRLGVGRFKVRTEKQNWHDGTFRSSLKFDELLPQFVFQTGAEFVSDRGYPCEWVYSQVFGRQTSFEALEKIDSDWADMGAVHILCRKSDYSTARPDELVPNDRLVELDEKYLEFAEWTRCDTIVMDVDGFIIRDDRSRYGEHDTNGQVEQVLRFLEALRVKRSDRELLRAFVQVASSPDKERRRRR